LRNLGAAFATTNRAVARAAAFRAASEHTAFAGAFALRALARTMTAFTLGHASPPGIEHRESVFFVVGKIVYVADVVHMQFTTDDLAFLLNGGISADAGGFGTNGEYALEIITVRHIPTLVTTIR
jgi:hypothetical protein